jgi:hypothetical protein
MKPRIIANPPIGIYTNPITTINHAAFLVVLDTIARYKSKFKGEEVHFPGKSYNFYGKRGDILLENGLTCNDYSELSRMHKEVIARDVAREKLNLSSLELLTDEEPMINSGTQKDFEKLYEKDYLFNKKGKFYLDCRKIAKDRDLVSMLEGIKFNPKRIHGEMIKLIEENTNNPVLITRDTKYAVTNPLYGDNIGPLFTLANLWNYKYPDCNITMAGSNSVLTKYVFLRFLTRAALENNPGMDELIIWPKIISEGGIKEWNLGELIKDKYHGDMVRCSILSSYSEKEQKVLMQKDRFASARNFVYSVMNLRKPLKGRCKENQEVKKACLHRLENLDFPLLIQESRARFKEMSLEINTKKDDNAWNEESREKMASEYMSIVETLEPLIPETFKLVKEDVNND